MLHKNSDFVIPSGSGCETVKRKIKSYIFFLVSYLISLPFYLLVRKGRPGPGDSGTVSASFSINETFWEVLRMLLRVN